MTPSQLWPGSERPVLGQTAPSEVNEGHVWGASTWLQRPLQQQAGDPNSGEQSVCTGEQPQQDADLDDGDLDIDSEIIGRAVRFIEELSTEESGSEDHSPIKGAAIEFPHAIKDSGLRPSNGPYRSMWNPQEPWVADVNGQGRLPSSGWAMRTHASC